MHLYTLECLFIHLVCSLKDRIQIRSSKWKLHQNSFKHESKTVFEHCCNFILLLIKPESQQWILLEKKTKKKKICLLLHVSSRCITCVFSLNHFSLQLSLLWSHQDGNGQASWLHLRRHTYQGALPLHLSFSFRLKHGPCQCTGSIYYSLSPSLFLPCSAVSATTQLWGFVKV